MSYFAHAVQEQQAAKQAAKEAAKLQQQVGRDKEGSN